MATYDIGKRRRRLTLIGGIGNLNRSTDKSPSLKESSEENQLQGLKYSLGTSD
jgi:hypothetical protein